MNCSRLFFFCCLGVGIIPGIIAAGEVRVFPPSLELRGQGEKQALLITWVEGEQATEDLTASSEFISSNSTLAQVDAKGNVTAQSNGSCEIRVKSPKGQAKVLVKVDGAAKPEKVSFRNEVIAILTRAGCNSGSCHGALAGKGGLKLSLRGYDPAADLFSLTREFHSRRINEIDPAESLLLAKPSRALPHGGGKKLPNDKPDYQLMRDWIAQGALDDFPNQAKLISLELFPPRAKLDRGKTVQTLVRGKYSNGQVRDVTRWAKFFSSDDQVATVDQDGLVTVSGHGEASIVAQFSSSIALSVVASPFPNTIPQATFTQSIRRNFIDELVLKKLEELQLPPSAQCTDEEFARRLFLDMAGILPTWVEVEAFVKDTRPDRKERLVDALLLRPETTDYWAYKWSDLFLISSKNLAQQQVWAFYQFIRKSVADNVPWDQFARSVLTVKGSNFSNGGGNFFLLHRDVTELTETMAVTFMGMSLTCAKCHNHPLEKWTQDQYWGMASLFARVGIKNGDAPSEALIESYPYGEVLHPRRGVAMAAAPLDFPPIGAKDPSDRREFFANWLTAKDNPFFARAIVNRVWRNFMGRGLIEAEDDLRQTNPPTNGPLLDALAQSLIANGYDMRKVMRNIVLSAAYQRSAKALPANAADDRYYSRFLPRRLKAEIILDACSQVTGVATPFDQLLSRAGDAKTAYNGYPKGTRALQLPDTSVVSRFLDAFGRPERAQACSCERQADASVAQALHVFNGNTLNDKLRASDFFGQAWLKEGLAPGEMVRRLFQAALSRDPSPEEAKRLELLLGDAFKGTPAEKREALEDVFWAVLTSREFLFNH